MSRACVIQKVSLIFHKFSTKSTTKGDTCIELTSKRPPDIPKPPPKIEALPNHIALPQRVLCNIEDKFTASPTMFEHHLKTEHRPSAKFKIVYKVNKNEVRVGDHSVNGSTMSTTADSSYQKSIMAPWNNFADGLDFLDIDLTNADREFGYVNDVLQVVKRKVIIRVQIHRHYYHYFKLNHLPW